MQKASLLISKVTRCSLSARKYFYKPDKVFKYLALTIQTKTKKEGRQNKKETCSKEGLKLKTLEKRRTFAGGSQSFYTTKLRSYFTAGQYWKANSYGALKVHVTRRQAGRSEWIGTEINASSAEPLRVGGLGVVEAACSRESL